MEISVNSNSESNESQSESESQSIDSNNQSQSINQENENTNKLNSEEIEMYLVEKVEVVYLNMKYETKYHTVLKILCFLLSIISYSFLFKFMFMFAVNRQNIYCFDTSYNQFELCSLDQVCKHNFDGISTIIYDDGPMSDTDDINVEFLNVNKKYKDFFYSNSINIFSKIAYDKLDMFSQFYEKFNGGVMLTEREQVNISLKYNDICNYKTSLIIFGMFVFIGTIIGNIFLTICSDIFGRKKILIVSLMICSLFCLLLFLVVMNIDRMINNYKQDFLDNQRKHYSDQYVEIIQQIYFNQQTYIIFKSYKIMLALFLMIIHLTNTSAQHSALCLLVENSINDSLIFKNYWIYNNGVILSLFYSYITTYPLNDFKYSFFISGVLMLCILIAVIYYIKESPRQHYEYSEWIEFTKIFNSIIKEKKDNIQSLYVPKYVYEEMKKIEDQALEKRQTVIKNSIILASKRNSVFEIIQQHLLQIKESLKKGQNLIIKRQELRMNPFIILTCLFYERKVRENNPTIWAYLIIVFFLFNINLNAIYARYFFTREGLFAIYIVNSSFFHITLVFLFSNLVFYIFLQFFGFKRVMTFCFIGVLIFAMIVDMPLTSLPRYLGDVNRYNFDLMAYYINDTSGKSIRVSIFVLGFFNWGIIYSTYIYIFKYTKTLYRCTFFGTIDIINKFAFFGAGLIAVYFVRSLLISAIVSFLGLFTIIFLTDEEEDINIISDKKKFEFNKSYK